MFVVLAIGGNIGPREQNLRAALKSLALCDCVYSNIYESPPLLPQHSPPCWNMSFLNMAVSGYTHMLPTELLRHVKQIEKTLGRRNYGFWGPRSIDIDILLCGSLTVKSHTLTIPHSAMHERDFVLVPTCEVCPRLHHPLLHKTLESLLIQLPNITVVKKHGIQALQRF